MTHASTSWNPGTIMPDLRERDPFAMEIILSKIYASALVIIIFQIIHCPRPYNSYNEAIIEEFIENTKNELILATQMQTEPSCGPAPTPALRHQTNGPKEPISILIMKLLLRSRIDLLRRVQLVCEHDIKTILRLIENQERQIERMRQNYEDLFMRLGHMEKQLQLRTLQLIELSQRLDTTQFVSADGTFVWQVDQVKLC